MKRNKDSLMEKAIEKIARLLLVVVVIGFMCAFIGTSITTSHYRKGFEFGEAFYLKDIEIGKAAFEGDISPDKYKEYRELCENVLMKMSENEEDLRKAVIELNSCIEKMPYKRSGIQLEGCFSVEGFSDAIQFHRAFAFAENLYNHGNISEEVYQEIVNRKENARKQITHHEATNFFQYTNGIILRVDE